MIERLKTGKLAEWRWTVDWQTDTETAKEACR
jgi:hypothetical protein